MATGIGSRIGPYEVTGSLGAGGMGAVYQARDTKLDRRVAIKILLDTVAEDAERLARFEREAKLLASLNHPHIAQVYGFEDAGATPALVMELVEGPTLADRIAQGALPIDEVLAIARQIASALEAAHEQGVIHRDLKPANIKRRADGTVKVLDFGLAKLADATTSGSVDVSAVTSPGMTRAGLVLGTPAYMSPEQARGRGVDARADIWAFGCVCYEMLAGQRAFDGETATDALSAVLTREPDWSRLPAGTPPALRRLLGRCLARDPARRLRHAGDVRLEIEEIASSPANEGAPAPARTQARTQATTASYLPWALATVATVVAIVLGWRTWETGGRFVADGSPTTRLDLALPPSLELFPSNASTILASPDGQSVVFVGTAAGERTLFLRALNAFESLPIRGTGGATTGTFSPDGRAVAFVTSGSELKTVSLTDGLVNTVTRGASLLYGLTWTPDDRIVFTRENALWVVSRRGGEATRLTTPGDGEVSHAWPSMLPDARRVIFTVETAAGPRIEAMAIDQGTRQLVLEHASRAKMGPAGRLFFYRDGRILATAFDAGAGRVVGSPAPVADVPDLGSGMPVGDVSPGGLLVFPAIAPERRLVWVDRQGAEAPATLDTSRAYLNPRLSPDNTRILVQMGGGIWVQDLRRDTLELLPTGPSTAANAFPAWVDNTTLIYRTGSGIQMQSTETGARGRSLPGTTEFDYPTSVTPDGKTVVFNRSSPDTSFDIMIAPLDDLERFKPLVQTPAYEGGASLSRDGRWVAYTSNESGRNEIYVGAAQGDRRWLVSSDGGSQPAWNPNGREIFYRIGDRMMSVAVKPVGADLELGAPRQLFSRRYAYGAGITIANYDVAKDGQRFLMVRDDSTGGHLRVIMNWRPDSAPAR